MILTLIRAPCVSWYRGECPLGQACHDGDDGSYDTVTTPVTRFMTGTLRQSSVPCKSQQDTGLGSWAHWAITSIAPCTAQWSPEGEEELPVTTAVCSALWDTRPWLQDDSIRLEFNGKLEKKEKKLWANVKQSPSYLCKYLIKWEESNSVFVS